MRGAREAVELGAAEEAAFLEAAARMRMPAKRKAAVELKAGLVSAEAWVAGWHRSEHTQMQRLRQQQG